jgi:hypothetical protein
MDKPMETPLLTEVGAVTKLTRGSAYLWPWYEPSAPPYDRICPVCFEEDLPT